MDGLGLHRRNCWKERRSIVLHRSLCNPLTKPRFPGVCDVFRVAFPQRFPQLLSKSRIGGATHVKSEGWGESAGGWCRWFDGRRSVERPVRARVGVSSITIGGASPVFVGPSRSNRLRRSARGCSGAATGEAPDVIGSPGDGVRRGGRRVGRSRVREANVHVSNGLERLWRDCGRELWKTRGPNWSCRPCFLRVTFS